MTEGERDLHPVPPPEATWLEITFQAGVPSDAADSAAATYTMRLARPLSAQMR
jgi:hypothetical protein